MLTNRSGLRFTPDSRFATQQLATSCLYYPLYSYKGWSLSA